MGQGAWRKRLKIGISFERFVKLLKIRINRHSGQAKRDPESRVFKQFWIPAPAPDPIRGSPERRNN
jgi:hypothetical protein